MMYEFDEEYGHGAVDPYEWELDEVEDIFGPYTEEYSYKPIPEDAPQHMAGFSHHNECTSPDGNPYDENCICRALYEKKARETREKEDTDLHEEYWQ